MRVEVLNIQLQYAIHSHYHEIPASIPFTVNKSDNSKYRDHAEKIYSMRRKALANMSKSCSELKNNNTILHKLNFG